MKYFGSSGIRTVFDERLLMLAFRVGLAVGGNHGSVVVGTDTRTTGDAMKHAVISGLLAAGARSSDAGIVPTPTLAFITREFDAGVMVTASHNPPEYNGLKLLNPDGSSYDISQQTKVEEALEKDSLPVAGWKDVKRGGLYPAAIERHIQAILADFPGKLNIRVVVDAGCGAASEVTPRLLEALGCEVVPLDCFNSGFFPRVIEPVDANLEGLKQAVVASGAALGIAHDGDADRMMAIDEKGRFITGDRLLAVLARAVGAKDMVTTLDASMAVDELGLKVRRTKIGDTWVSEELRKGGDFGGETSGAWIFPGISLCPDGIYAAAQVAALTARRRLSEVVDAVPVYPLRRGSVSSRGVDLKKMETALMSLAPQAVSRLDGLKLEFDDGWLLVRPSGTEPKMRLTAEARTDDRVQQLYEAAVSVIQKSLKKVE
jgi:phosphoglucosamine mutase